MRPKVVRDISGKQKSKIEKVIDYLKEIHGNNFTGYIKINYTQGNIGRIERFEEILKPSRD
jgi:hypothetical protein